MKYRITLSRVYEFSAAHRLHVGRLSDEQNIRLYDKCNNPQGHGHDYKLEVTLQGEPDRDTGMIIDLGEMDLQVRKILDQLDYRHLNHEVDFFKTHVSTGEMIIQFLWNELSKQVPGNRLYYLKLWETNNNYFELGGLD
jgi:6-pyruvoyltetrahydropterin/6-carboxytetrahydropterin synthase